MAVPPHVMELGSSEHHESEDQGFESTGDEPDNESESVYDLLLHMDVFGDEVEFESECYLCRYRRWCILCQTPASVIAFV